MSSHLRTKRRAQAAADPLPNPGRGDSLGIVKWIVPSIGVLMATVGFVAESAHQALLGLELGDLGVRAYFWSAVVFLRELFAALATVWLDPGFFVGSPSLPALLLVAVGTVLLLRKLPWPSTWSAVRMMRAAASPALYALLLVASAAWVWTVDLPATRLENLLGRGSTSLEAQLTQDLGGVGVAGPGTDGAVSAARRAIAQRSVAMFEWVACSRHPYGRYDLPGLKCTGDRDYRIEVQRFVLVMVALGAGCASLAALLWARGGSAARTLVLAPLALHALLSPVYLYGKFWRPTDYDSALVQFKSAIAISAMPTDRRVPEYRGAELDKLRSAIILARDDKFLTLYVNQPKSCGAGKVVYEWVQWRVSLGDVFVLRDLTSFDVITERLKQEPCPLSGGLPPPPPPAP